MVGFLKKKDVFKKQNAQETFNQNGFYIFAVTKDHRSGVLSLGAFETPDDAREKMFSQAEKICPSIQHFETFSAEQAINMVKHKKAPPTKKRRKNIFADQFIKKDDQSLDDKNPLVWDQYKAVAQRDETLVGFAVSKDKNDKDIIAFVHKDDVVKQFSQAGEYLYGDQKSSKHTCGSLKKSPHMMAVA